MYHKVIMENPQLKNMLDYNLADEEFLLYKCNIYESQP